MPGRTNNPESTVAVTLVELTNVVCNMVFPNAPPHRMLAPLSIPLPFAVSVKVAPPEEAVVGEIEEMVAGGYCPSLNRKFS